MGLKACLWNEDIDLTGGSAAITAALAAGIRGGFGLVGTDTIRAPSGAGQRIVGVISGTETAAIELATLTIAGTARPHDFGGTYVAPLHVFQDYGLNIPLPSEAIMAWEGYDHAAACQEFASIIIDDPSMPDPWGITKNPRFDETLNVNITTPARVAVTQSGHTDICGRTTAYTGGQAQIPNDPTIDIYVLKIVSRDAAGYSGIGLEAPGHEANLDFPTMATVDTVYDMDEIFGGALHCTAARPFNVYGFGVGAATQTLSSLTLGVKW